MSREGVVLWAGRRLSSQEERSMRDLVAMLRRNGAADTAEGFERFLPEHDERWTPDELEAGAHAGPWLSVSADARPE